MSKINRVEEVVSKFETRLELCRLMTDEQLAEAFAEAVEMTADGLTRMAAIVCSYDERGR
jgi:hypothetical protein